MSNQVSPRPVADRADKPAFRRAAGPKARRLPAEAGSAEKRREALLDEALEESFPASDPVSSLSFT